jgi:hypothetical protein
MKGNYHTTQDYQARQHELHRQLFLRHDRLVCGNRPPKE